MSESQQKNSFQMNNKQQQQQQQSIQSPSQSNESWNKLQPILEKYILKNNITSLDKGMDLLLQWFETISKSTDKINTFKSIVGLNPENNNNYGSDRNNNNTRMSYSTSSIGDLISNNTTEDNKKRILMDLNNGTGNGNGDDQSSLFDFRNKRMKVSRLLCHEEMLHNPMNEKEMMINTNGVNISGGGNGGMNKNSDCEENSEGTFDEDENSCPDSFDSNDNNSPEDNVYGSDNESLHIDEDNIIMGNSGTRSHHHAGTNIISHHPTSMGRKSNSTHSTIDLTHIKLQPSQQMQQIQLQQQLQMQQQMQQQQMQMQQQAQQQQSSSGVGKSPTIAGNNSIAPSPKQLMTIREKMLEYIQKNPSATRPTCIQVVQQPSSKVVWKNRRLDTPFKVKVDLKAASAMAGQNLTTANVISIGIVTDHKGKLQIDSVENFTEAFNGQGLAVFQGLKMTKGTWGKEWNLTFIAVVRPNNASYNNPMIISVSQPFSIVVKTRKNPQIRHNSYSSHLLAANAAANAAANNLNNGTASEGSSSSPEASPTIAPRRGRPNSVAPVMSLSQQAQIQAQQLQLQQQQAQAQQQNQQQQSSTPITTPPSNSTTTTSPSPSPSTSTASTTTTTTTTTTTASGGRTFGQDEMASLLWAAEIKQNESEPETITGNPPTTSSSNNNNTKGNSNYGNNVIINTPKPVTTR